MKKRIVIALSGGIDSAIAGYLLLEKGWDVIGVTLDLLSSSNLNNSCLSYAKEVAKSLKIPHFVLDLKKEFEEEVVKYFIEEYLNGRTPNPCILCNHRIKFGYLLDRLSQFKAEYLASGHYAKVEYSPEDRLYKLKKGRDLNKDQSYFLFTLDQKRLKNVIFPLGDHRKKEVEMIAKKINLEGYNKRESQEICFIPGNNYRIFLRERKVRFKRGPIIDKKGNILGEHHGIYLFTIGQRKGLGISYKNPLYVIKIDKDKNTIVVGKKEDLLNDILIADKIHWVNRNILKKVIYIKAKIRYTHFPIKAEVTLISDNRALVRFSKPQEAITPGQAVVFYRGEEVVGGGFIKEVGEECLRKI